MNDADFRVEFFPFQKGALPFQLVRQPRVVGVEQGQPVAGRFACGAVSGGGGAAVDLPDHADIRAEIFRNRRRLVFRAIIYNNNFMRGYCLRQNAANRRAKRFCRVIGRNESR